MHEATPASDPKRGKRSRPCRSTLISRRKTEPITDLHPWKGVIKLDNDYCFEVVMWSPNTSYVPFRLSLLAIRTVEIVLEKTDPVLEGISLTTSQ